VLAGYRGRMISVAVWRPDALIGPAEYGHHVDEALRVLCRGRRADVMLSLALDEDRPLIEVVCARTREAGGCELVASIAHGDDEDVFPLVPSDALLADLGWERVTGGRFSAWVLGPVPGDTIGLDALSMVLLDTLTGFGCPLGFVELRLQRLGDEAVVAR
jgi:hypothetical protein